jgi:hypothetical protein
MSKKVWKAALKLANDYGEAISIGGGEPTIHPKFNEFLMDAISASQDEGEPIWLATNGSITKTALLLSKLASCGVIACTLSQDSYHDPIDERVVEAFEIYDDRNRQENDFRSIRNVDGKEIVAGRCTWGKQGCICESLFVEPSGTIRACGCADAPVFGTVFDPKIPEGWDFVNCHKEQTQCCVA